MTAQNIRDLGKITDDRDRLVCFAICMQNTLMYSDRLTKLGLPPIEKSYFVRMSGDNEEDRKYLGIIRLSPTKSGKILLATVRTFESWINSRREFYKVILPILHIIKISISYNIRCIFALS